ncbi:MAG: hypothetical protein R3A47_04295 [Polyangiales bacterium]
MPFQMDIHDFPLVHMVFEGEFDEHSWEADMLEIPKVVKKRGKFAFCIDCTNIGSITPNQRRTISKLVKNDPYGAFAQCIAMGITLPATWQRGMLTAIMWITPFSMPVQAFKTHDETTAWVRSELTRAGVADASDERLNF